MNLNKIFNIITEAAEVEKIKASVGDKVPASVMDKLAESAKKTNKGSYFDNEAMAIIKSVSGGNKDEFLLSHPGAVHGVLKILKKGNSSFNAASILAGGSGKEYWMNLYKKSKEEKSQENKNSFGLKNAKFKELKKYYAIFPKTFYEDYYFSKKENLEKGWLELRTISDEIAKKDNSGESGADVNHWCVASSSSHYYENYKKDGGVFIIIVKKEEDRKPNWNERYLWYTNGKRCEFADKFNNHIQIPDSLTVFFDKIIKKFTVNYDKKNLVNKRFKELDDFISKNTVTLKTKKEVLEHPKAELIQNNINSIVDFLNINNKNIIRTIVLNIIKTKFPGFLNENILEEFHKHGKLDQNNDTYEIIYELASKTAEEKQISFFLKTEKEGFMVFKPNLHSNSINFIALGYDSLKKFNQKIKTYFDTNKNIWVAPISKFKVWDYKPIFNYLNVKYEQFSNNEKAKKYIEDGSNNVINFPLHVPFITNELIITGGKKIHMQFPSKMEEIGNIDDPNILEKFKNIYRNGLKQMFPAWEPVF